MIQEDGKLTGPLYQKLSRHAVNSSSVGVQHAREDANVPRHHFSVLHLATMVDCVLITLFAYQIFNFCSLGAICVVASMLKIVPLHSPLIKM